MASQKVDENVASTYAFIYAFLVKQEHRKAADALKKAVKDIVVLKAGMDTEGPSLNTIIKEWKALKEKETSESSESESDSDSSSDDSSDSSDSGSDSSSSSSASDTDSKVKTKAKSKTKISAASAKSSVLPSSSAAVKPAASGKTREPSRAPSSKTLSSEASDTDPDIDSDSDSSSDPSSDSDESESSEEEEPKASNPKAVATKVTQKVKVDKTAKETDSSDSSSDSSESDSASESDVSSSDESTQVKQKGAKGKSVTKAEEAKEQVQVTKKRRTNEDGASVATAVVDADGLKQNRNITAKSNGAQMTNGKDDMNGEVNGKKPRKSNTPFQRIKVDKITYAHEGLKDNRFESRGATETDYGARASADLIVTRGAGFRKEKNKKKRGSYHGGDITMQSHSIKFTD